MGFGVGFKVKAGVALVVVVRVLLVDLKLERGKRRRARVCEAVVDE